MARKKKWLYKRSGRFYADFRGYADVGGGQEALIPEGERYATKDHRTAKQMAKARLAELRRLRKAGHADRDDDLRKLGQFVDYHLEREARRKGADSAHLAQLEQRLEVAVEFFGAATLLRSISTLWLQEYVDYLAERVKWEGTSNPGTEPIKPTTQRKYLRALSKLFRRARAVQVIPGHHRPFSDLMELPEVEDEEAVWLDGPTAALFLEAARLYRPKRPEMALPCAYTIVAVILLTGMRPSEALGLLIEDVDFDRKLIRVRRNRARRLKNRKSRRLVPLWPQLEAILRAYLDARGGPAEGYLFPSPKRAGPVKAIKRLITELAIRIDHEPTLTPKALRHTYCAARLQTTDAGKPIAHLKVARELGHRDTEMVERIYGHVDTRESSFPRRPFVAFEMEDYDEELVATRLDALEVCSRKRNLSAPNLSKRVPAETELAVLRIAGEKPNLGPRKAAGALHEAGHDVSASGVRWIWKRYELHREELRREAARNGTLRRVIAEVTELRKG